jgi:hypothetical protein
VEVVVTDAEGKTREADGDEEDVTRSASPASFAPPGPVTGVDAASPAAAEGAAGGSPGSGSAVLKRVSPEEGTGEVVSLSTDDYLLGRSSSCNVRLNSATASRQHARIERRGGEWFLSSVDGKTVVVDGHPAYDEVRLQSAMKIQLGGDEFLFLQEGSSGEGLEEEETLVQPSSRVGTRLTPAPAPRRGPRLWIAVFAGVGVLVALAFWLRL